MGKKRADHNSKKGELQNFANARAQIMPPDQCTLRAGDWPFWIAITEVRAADSWNDVDLAKAANLARCQADIERLSAELEEEGDTVENARGTMVMNPKHSLLEILSRREVALSRVLHVHAEATVGRARDSGNKSKAQRDKREAIAVLKSDGLIPGLN